MVCWIHKKVENRLSVDSTRMINLLFIPMNRRTVCESQNPYMIFGHLCARLCTDLKPLLNNKTTNSENIFLNKFWPEKTPNVIFWHLKEYLGLSTNEMAGNCHVTWDTAAADDR